MQQFLFVILATFWAWATLRYVAEQYVPTAFYATRVAHPLLVAGGTTYLCYPDLVRGCAAAGAVGLLVSVMDRFLDTSAPAPVQTQRPASRMGLPPLP